MPGMLTSRIASATSCLSSSSSAAGPDSASRIDDVRPCQRRFQRGDVVRDVVDDQNVDGLRHLMAPGRVRPMPAEKRAAMASGVMISCTAPRSRSRRAASRWRTAVAGSCTQQWPPVCADRERAARAVVVRARQHDAEQRLAVHMRRRFEQHVHRWAAKSARADRPTARSCGPARPACDSRAAPVDRAGRDFVLVVRLDDRAGGNAHAKMSGSRLGVSGRTCTTTSTAGAKPSGSPGSRRLSASMPPAERRSRRRRLRPDRRGMLSGAELIATPSGKYARGR